MALRFWKKKLAESVEMESEEDQEEEKKGKKSKKKDKADDAEADDAGTDDAGAEDDFDLDDFMPPEGGDEGGDDSGDEDPEAKIADLEAEIEELKAKLAKYEGGDEGSDEGGDEDLEDGSDEEDSDEEDSEEDSDEEDDKEDDSGKKVDESRKYKPNTVGAVIQLLEKFNPKSKLMIRMNPGKYSCMPINVSGKLSLNGHGCTYMDIAKGQPMNEAADVKLPVHMIAFLGKLARVQKRLGKGATDKDIAEKMDITVDQVKKLKEIAKQISK